MKKFLFLLTVLLFLGGCSKPEIEPIDSDSLKFKEMYESLNGLKTEYGDSYTKVEIKENNPVHLATSEEVLNVLDKSGIILLAFPECPWCRMTIPVLLDACEKVGISKINYLNNKEERNEIEIINGEAVETKKGSEDYQKILEKVSDYAENYGFEDYEDDSLKRIYFPTVIVVKDGEIILYHTATVESQTDPYVPLTSEQYEELYGIFREALNKYKNACSINKGC